MIRSISVNLVQTEFDYNKYVSESYREQYPYEVSKDSLPWIVITAVKGDEGIPEQNKLTLSPEPDFSAIVDSEAIKKSADGKSLELNWSGSTRFMLAVNTEVYPEGGFDGNADVSLYVGDSLEAATERLDAKLVELTVDQCQEIIDLYYRQQGKPTEAKLLDTLVKKVYGVKIENNADAAAMKAADVEEVPETIADEPEAESADEPETASTAEESVGGESIE